MSKPKPCWNCAQLKHMGEGECLYHLVKNLAIPRKMGIVRPSAHVTLDK